MRDEITIYSHKHNLITSADEDDDI